MELNSKLSNTKGPWEWMEREAEKADKCLSSLFEKEPMSLQHNQLAC